MTKTIDQLHAQAKADFVELKKLLEESGILSLTAGANFFAKIRELPIIDPRIYYEEELVDFEYGSISATIFWAKDKPSPELSTIVDIWDENEKGFYYATTVDLEEI